MLRTNFLFILCIFILTNYGCETASPEAYNITDHYIPCGWMGCGASDSETIVIDERYGEDPHSGADCIKVDFKACNQDDTGIYWINNHEGGRCNWGDVPGNNFSTMGYTKLTFWVKGTTGEELIKFGIGGIKKNGKLHKDTLSVFESVRLTKNWKKYTLRIGEESLHSVIGGFYWYALNRENKNGGVFYLDDIQLR